MVRFIILVLTLISMGNFVYASEAGSEPKDYYNFLTKKTIEDFNSGVELYNSTKDPAAPVIKKGSGNYYNLVVKKNRVRFTILNYLNDQMYVNNKLVQISTFGLKNTTVFNFFISEAVAAEDELDGDSTRIILTALGSLSGKLEEVGMICFAACERTAKKNNKAKIYATLDTQLEDCNQQMDAQSDTLKKYPTYQMVSLLHSTFNPEFTGVKNLFQKVAEANSKKVKEFMETKLMVNKNYKTCVEVITAGTVADGAYNPVDRGINVLRAGGATSVNVEEEIANAQKICGKMEELRMCLVNLKKNLNAINSIKRNINKEGYNLPIENLPNINGIER